MSKLSESQNCVEPEDFFKLPVTKVNNKSGDHTNTILSGSCGDLSKVSSKHSQSILSRDDSVSSKNSFAFIFPNLMKSFDYSSGFNINQSFVPRPEKTLHLFEIILGTLKDLHKNYSLLTRVKEDFSERSEGGHICSKVDTRIMLLETMKNEYEALMEDKEVELRKIQNTLTSVISSKNGKEELDMMDCETYWSICREMCVAEMKLERCCGKLQFQIMQLDSVTRVNPSDQYELSIRLNDVSKFKSRIKIEKGGHQVWDNTTFTLTPFVDDILDVKFCELKTLNKALILLERKMSSINNLIMADPSIFTFWLTPVGTIKLQVIVQWNALLDDPDLVTNLSQLDNKYQNVVIKDGVMVRTRANSTSNKYFQNRLSVNFGQFIRSEDLDKISSRGSMENIAEDVDEDKTQKVHFRKNAVERKSEKTKAKYHEDFIVEDTHLERTSEPNNVTIKFNEKEIIVPKIITNESVEIQQDAPMVSGGNADQTIEVKENIYDQENMTDQRTVNCYTEGEGRNIKDSNMVLITLVKDADVEGRCSGLEGTDLVVESKEANVGERYFDLKGKYLSVDGKYFGLEDKDDGAEGTYSGSKGLSVEGRFSGFEKHNPDIEEKHSNIAIYENILISSESVKNKAVNENLRNDNTTDESELVKQEDTTRAKELNIHEEDYTKMGFEDKFKEMVIDVEKSKDVEESSSIIYTPGVDLSKDCVVKDCTMVPTVSEYDNAQVILESRSLSSEVPSLYSIVTEEDDRRNSIDVATLF